MKSRVPSSINAATNIENNPIASSVRSAIRASPAALTTARTRKMAVKATVVTPPARIAPTMPGASPYASGFHVCIGARPIFVPYPTSNNTHAVSTQGRDKLAPCAASAVNVKSPTPPPCNDA